MTLLDDRIAFTRCLGQLLTHAADSGLDVVVCEVLRSQAGATWAANHCAKVVDGERCEQVRMHPVHDHHTFVSIGSARSVHLHGLAVDLYVIVNKQISNDPMHYAAMALFWKSLLPGRARWGGDFSTADLGHFSFEINGVQ